MNAKTNVLFFYFWEWNSVMIYSQFIEEAKNFLDNI